MTGLFSPPSKNALPAGQRVLFFIPGPRPRPPGCRPRRRRRSRRRSPPPRRRGTGPAGRDWKVSSRRMRTGEEDRVSTPVSTPSGAAKPRSFRSNRRQGLPAACPPPSPGRHRSSSVQRHAWAVGGPDGTRSLGGPLLSKSPPPAGRGPGSRRPPPGRPPAPTPPGSAPRPAGRRRRESPRGPPPPRKPPLMFFPSRARKLMPLVTTLSLGGGGGHHLPAGAHAEGEGGPARGQVAGQLVIGGRAAVSMPEPYWAGR